MNLSKYMTLSEGEEVLQEIEGDAYNLDSSPIARMMGAIVRNISIALGIRKKTHLIVTNKRVVRINFEKVFWVIDKGVTAISMTARSINNVGYSNIRRLVIFKTRYFMIGTSGEDTLIKFQGNDKALFDAVDNVNNILEKIITK
jgi:hypothetical protein